MQHLIHFVVVATRSSDNFMRHFIKQFSDFGWRVTSAKHYAGRDSTRRQDHQLLGTVGKQLRNTSGRCNDLMNGLMCAISLLLTFVEKRKL